MGSTGPGMSYCLDRSPPQGGTLRRCAFFPWAPLRYHEPLRELRAGGVGGREWRSMSR